MLIARQISDVHVMNSILKAVVYKISKFISIKNAIAVRE
jgi:hypothetical protein